MILVGLSWLLFWALASPSVVGWKLDKAALVTGLVLIVLAILFGYGGETVDSWRKRT